MAPPPAGKGGRRNLHTNAPCVSPGLGHRIKYHGNPKRRGAPFYQNQNKTRNLPESSSEGQSLDLGGKMSLPMLLLQLIPENTQITQ